MAASANVDMRSFYFTIGTFLLLSFIWNLKKLFEDDGDDWFSDCYKKAKKAVHDTMSSSIRRRRLAYVN